MQQRRSSTMTTMDVWYDHPPRHVFILHNHAANQLRSLIPQWLGSPFQKFLDCISCSFI